ncbi:MAG: cupin domain-containing protein, partial [Rubrivivax sp.]
GPHLDSYDVFQIQVEGQRRWRIGKARDKRLVEDAPLKILRHFEPEHEWLMEPGDMLYLPPQWAHEGVAVGNCLTASVGFRAPAAHLLTRELLERVADAIDADEPGALYADPAQPATARPAAIPPALQAFATKALRRALDQPQMLAQALGESLSEPKSNVFFEASTRGSIDSGVVLDRRSRMLYDRAHVFINGESFKASGHDARMMRRLADRRCLSAGELVRLSSSARQLMVEWRRAGWLQEAPE